MCSQPPKKRDDSDKIHDILKLIRLIDPNTKYLGITGGEPTLLKDDLFKIVEELKAYLPSTHITMLSNGRMFYYNSFASKFAQIKHPNFTIAIPLYSAIAEEHDYVVQAENAFTETIRGLYNLGRLNQRIEIRVVIHALTYKRLPALAEYIYHNLPFVEHIALMGLEIMGYVKKNFNELWIDPYDYQTELIEAVEYFVDRGMHVSIYNHQLCVLAQQLWPFARKSISDWKNIYLEECTKCTVLDNCGGLFKSAESIHSKYIHSL